MVLFPIKSIILIDGYDAARSTETRRFFRDLIAELIHELHPSWHIIVSIRIYDARKAQTLLDLFPLGSDNYVAHNLQVQDMRCRHFLVPLFSTDEVQEAVNQIDGLNSIYSNSSINFQELLRFPFNLWLVERLLKANPSLSELGAVTSETELLSFYWQYRIGEHELSHQMNDLLLLLARNMVEHLNLVVRRETVFAYSQISQVIDELLSLEVIRYSSVLQQGFEFSHNILFDYAVARLLIPDNPSDFITFFETDYFRPIFLLPSIEYYFSYLWLNQPSLFWEVFLVAYASDVPVQIKLFARLIPPRIIVSHLEHVEHLTPLIEALTNSSPNIPIAVAAVFRRLLAHGVKQAASWSKFLSSIVHNVEREFVVDFTKVTDELIAIGKDSANDEILNQCGLIARSLGEWVLIQRDSSTRGWLDRIGSRLIFPLIAKTFKTDLEGSRSLIERIIRLTKHNKVPLEYLSGLVDVFNEIIQHDPKLIANIYDLVFQSSELGDGSPFVGGGAVVQFVMSAQSEREGLEHKLVWYYPQFLNLHLALGTTIGMKCINHIVIRDHIANRLSEHGTLEDGVPRIRFRNGEAIFLRDYNYIWSSRTPQNHDPMYMIEIIFDHIERIASEGKLDENNLSALLDLFRDNAQVAYLWARLLQTGSLYPEVFAIPLLELILNHEILYGDSTAYQLGKFLEIAPNYYSLEKRRSLEKAILAKPLSEKDPQRLEFLERRRNRLIARLPQDKIVTDEAIRIRKAIDASNENHENLPLVSFTTHWETYDYDENRELQEHGVDLHSEPNQRIQRLYTPLRTFKDEWNNKIPNSNAIEDILPDIRELFLILQGEPVSADDRVVQLAWTYLSECVERMCLSQKEDSTHFDFFKGIMLACSKHSLPTPDPTYDAQYNDPHWSPSPRTSAAQGLLILAYYQKDQEILESILLLSQDPVPSVRFLIAHRLFFTYHHSPDFFWQCIEEIIARESNHVVLGAIYENMKQPKIKQTQKAQHYFSTIIENLLVIEPNGELIENVITILPWYMFEVQADWAFQVSSKIVESPRQYAKIFAHLAFQAKQPIKPDMLFSEEQKPIFRRAVQWIIPSLEAAHGSIIALLNDVKKNGWTDHARNDLQHLQRVIDDVVTQIYFSSDIPKTTGIPNNGRKLSDDERREYYFEVKDILIKLSQLALNDTLGTIPAYTTHHFMELMNGVLRYDPVDILHIATDITKSSRGSGYQFDSLAVREVIELIETLLADHQDKLKNNVLLKNLFELLDIFAEAGWSEALDLVDKLSEITR